MGTTCHVPAIPSSYICCAGSLTPFSCLASVASATIIDPREHDAHRSPSRITIIAPKVQPFVFFVPYDGSSLEPGFKLHETSCFHASCIPPVFNLAVADFPNTRTSDTRFRLAARGCGPSSSVGGLRAEGSTWVQTLHLLGLKTPS